MQRKQNEKRSKVYPWVSPYSCSRDRLVCSRSDLGRRAADPTCRWLCSRRARSMAIGLEMGGTPDFHAGWDLSIAGSGTDSAGYRCVDFHVDRSRNCPDDDFLGAENCKSKNIPSRRISPLLSDFHVCRILGGCGDSWNCVCRHRSDIRRAASYGSRRNRCGCLRRRQAVTLF